MNRELTFLKAIIFAEDITSSGANDLQSIMALQALSDIPAIKTGERPSKEERRRLEALSTVLQHTVNNEPIPQNPALWPALKAVGEFRQKTLEDLQPIFAELNDEATLALLRSADPYKPLYPQIGFASIPVLDNYESLKAEMRPQAN